VAVAGDIVSGGWSDDFGGSEAIDESGGDGDGERGVGGGERFELAGAERGDVDVYDSELECVSERVSEGE
jgi:hypothetical protein